MRDLRDGSGGMKTGKRTKMRLFMAPARLAVTGPQAVTAPTPSQNEKPQPNKVVNEVSNNDNYFLKAPRQEMALRRSFSARFNKG